MYYQNSLTGFRNSDKLYYKMLVQVYKCANVLILSVMFQMHQLLYILLVYVYMYFLFVISQHSDAQLWQVVKVSTGWCIIDCSHFTTPNSYFRILIVIWTWVIIFPSRYMLSHTTWIMLWLSGSHSISKGPFFFPTPTYTALNMHMYVEYMYVSQITFRISDTRLSLEVEECG